MDKLTLRPPNVELTAEEKELWERTLTAGVIAQRLIDGSIAVGGTATSIYARHRVSFDTDHVLMNLKEHFDEVLDKLSASPEWKIARLNRPVLILGSINAAEVGFRPSRRSKPIETRTVTTPYGDMVIPTLEEMLGMKAVLAYQRKTVRDFLDFAALSQCITEDEVIESLMKVDERYGDLQTHSVRLEVARTLAEPKPVDFATVDLSHYRSLAPEWREWARTEQICRKFGLLLGEKLIGV